MNVREALARPECEWEGKPPASEEEIALLKSKARAESPIEYLELLQFSNGGEGPVALAPIWFQLYPVDECITLCHNSQHVLEEFPNFTLFGSNGGLESIAFDLRVGPPWRIVMIDQVAGAESAMVIAPSMAVFVDAIGLEAEGQE